MSISETYIELLLEKIIKDILSEGATPSVSEITSRFEALNADTSSPVFDATKYICSPYENSSVSKFNSTLADIQWDLQALYRHMLKISESTLMTFERWRGQGNLLEGRLDDLPHDV